MLTETENLLEILEFVMENDSVGNVPKERSRPAADEITYASLHGEIMRKNLKFSDLRKDEKELLLFASKFVLYFDKNLSEELRQFIMAL